MVSQPKVTILIPKGSGGSFVLWKWSEKDYGKSVSVFVGDCKVDITFVRDTYSKEQERMWPMYMQYKMNFDYPSQTLIKGLTNPNSETGEEVAKEIYRIYSEATEKINRMKTNDECCSFQSEDEEQKQFGGGIRTTNYFIAPSGFPPHLDQKFAVMIALVAEELRVQDYEKIMNSSFTNVNTWRKRNGEPIITLSQF